MKKICYCKCKEGFVLRNGERVRVNPVYTHNCEYVALRENQIEHAERWAINTLAERGVSPTDTRYGNQFTSLFAMRMEELVGLAQRMIARQKKGQLL